MANRVELLRRNNTSAVLGEDGEIQVTVRTAGAVENSPASSGVQAMPSGATRTSMNFDVGPVRGSPIRSIKKSVSNSGADGLLSVEEDLRTTGRSGALRTEMPSAVHSTIDFDFESDRESDVMPNQRKASARPESETRRGPSMFDTSIHSAGARVQSPPPPPPPPPPLQHDLFDDEVPTSRRLSHYGGDTSSVFMESDFYRSDQHRVPDYGTGSLMPFSEANVAMKSDTARIAEELAAQNVSYFDKSTQILSPYRRTTKADLLRPFKVRSGFASDYTYSPSSFLASTSFANSGRSPKARKTHEPEELFDYDSLKPPVSLDAAEIVPDFMPKEEESKQAQQEDDDSEEKEDNLCSIASRLSSVPRRREVKAYEEDDDDEENLDYKTNVSPIPKKNTFAASSLFDDLDPFAASYTGDVGFLSSRRSSGKRFASRLAQEAYESRLQEEMEGAQVGLRETRFLFAKAESGPQPTGIRTTASYQNVDEQSFSNSRNSRMSRKEKSATKRDPLAIDLDRFKYAPRNRAFQVTPVPPSHPPPSALTGGSTSYFSRSSEYLRTGGEVYREVNNASGLLGGSLPISMARGGVDGSTTRHTSFFLSSSTRAAMKKRRHERETREEEDDDICKIAKHVMEQPLGTLERLRDHFINKVTEPQSNEPLRRLVDESVVHQLEDEKAKTQKELERLQQQLSQMNHPAVPDAAVQRTGSSRAMVPPPPPPPGAPAPPPSSHRIADIRMVTRGAVFNKTTTKGNTHRRFVYVSPDYRTVYWSSPETVFAAGETRTMSLIGARIRVGQKTVPFQRRHEEHLMNRCFSIDSPGFRTLDLEVIRANTASSPEDEMEQRDEWVDAFQQAIDRANASVA